MAQLKDTVISGSLRVTDTTYTTTADVSFIKVSTAAGAAAHGTGTAGQALISNGASAAYWGTPGNATNASQLGGSAASTYLQGDDVKAGSGITVSTAAGVATVSADLRTTTKLGAAGATAAATETTKIYAVQMDSNGDLAVKVPWTDTDTKVTAVGNHYTPTSSGTFSPAAGGTTTDISTTTLNIITGLQKDAKGHITGVVSGSIKSTNTPNTDEKLKMTPASATKFYPAGGTSQTSAVSTAYFSSAVYIQGTSVVATNFVGTATTASYAGTASYIKTPGAAGYVTDQYGNLKHQEVTATDNFQLRNNANTPVAKYYWETGNFETTGNITANKVQVGGTAVTLQYNSTTKSLDFVFA